MTAKNQVLVLLHHSTGWVSAADLLSWVEYSKPNNFRFAVLKPLHEARLIEFDTVNRRASISPLGVKKVEEELLEAAK
jgi:hypothetical protein